MKILVRNLAYFLFVRQKVAKNCLPLIAHKTWLKRCIILKLREQKLSFKSKI